ncbi:MAG: FAD-dependent oxidoreductase [Burkholderiales bacterium]|nr:FAD-dependent oxidoreductase [Burkholderiales bacterium]
MVAAEAGTHWDVVVVGAGGAGLSAAAEAAAAGRRVLVLEKGAAAGGSTSWAVGTMTASNSPLQRRAGIDDNADWHFEDLGKHNGALDARDNARLRRILVDQSTPALEWLMALGVVFVGPMPEPPHRVARMHNVVPNAKAFTHCLARHCRRLGVEIRTRTRAVGLLVERGRVTGVECTTDAGKQRFNATRGVVLASGDYSADRDLKSHFARPEVVEVEAVNPAASGDGHKLALALGAEVVNGDIVRGPIMRFVPPRRPSWLVRLPPSTLLGRVMAWSYAHLPRRVLRPFLLRFLTTALGPSPRLFERGAILVNIEGRRFCDELDAPAHEVVKQPYKIAFIVFDQALAEQFEAWPNFVSTAPGISYAYLADYRRTRRDIYHSARTLEALAEAIGVPTQTLERTLESYNALERHARPALSRGPYYALGPLKSYCVFADGGLRVSERLQVLDRTGAPIAGLFAAGSAGQGGVLLEGHGHHLAWAFVSGRIAGRNVAESASIEGPAA